MIRITADLDFKNKWKVSYYTLKAFVIIKSIKELKLTPSAKKGYHLEIFSNYPYNLKSQFELRRKIGDDLHRLSMDKIRNFGRNTLFQRKEKFKKTDLV